MNSERNLSGFKQDEIVWAKLRGFPSWPAKISRPTDRKPIPFGKVYVIFFGTAENAFINVDSIYPFEENFDKFYKTTKSKPLLRAYNEIMSIPRFSHIFSSRSIKLPRISMDQKAVLPQDSHHQSVKIPAPSDSSLESKNGISPEFQGTGPNYHSLESLGHELKMCLTKNLLDENKCSSILYDLLSMPVTVNDLQQNREVLELVRQMSNRSASFSKTGTFNPYVQNVLDRFNGIFQLAPNDIP